MTQKKYLLTFLSLLSVTHQIVSFPILSDSFTFETFLDEYENQTSNITNNSCNSYSCYYIRDVFRGQMNFSVDPCEDFYKFSCGNFLEKNALIPSGVLERLHFEFLRKTDEVLSEAGTTNLSSIKNTKQFYNSCKEQDSMTFLRSLMSFFRGLSISNNTIKTNYQNATLNESNSLYNLILMNRLGFDVLFELRIDINPFNTSRYSIWIERTSVLSTTFDELALHSILLELNKFKKSKSNWTTYVDSVSKMVNEFSQVEINSPIKETPKHNQISIKELQEKIPHFNWTYFLIDGVYKNDQNYTLDENEIIIHNDLDYLFAITKVFHKFSIENELYLNDLLIWTFIISELGPYKYFQLNYAPFNFSVSPPSESNLEFTTDTNINFGSGHCLSFTSELMKFSIARLLADKYFKSSNISKSKIEDIVDRIKKEFISVINENDWMDSQTRNISLKKINSMEIKIGYPDFIFDDKTLEEIYKDFIFGNDFFSNLLKLRKINYDENLVLLMSDVNKTLWKSNPFDVNAYYYPLFNQIYLSAGLLILPIYNDLIPNFINYGSLGTIIGHEIIHGFDSNGRFYDQNGNFYPDESEALWTNKSISVYENRTQCLVDQFNEFFKHESNKTKTNGLETLAENIADNMGLQLSYKAFKKWSKQNEAEQSLRGFEEFTPEQMFFISYGQIWCEVNTSIERFSSAKTYHSPHSFRVNGAVSNFDEFYKAFKCNKKNDANVCKLF